MDHTIIEDILTWPYNNKQEELYEVLSDIKAENKTNQDSMIQIIIIGPTGTKIRQYNRTITIMKLFGKISELFDIPINLIRVTTEKKELYPN